MWELHPQINNIQPSIHYLFELIFSLLLGLASKLITINKIQQTNKHLYYITPIDIIFGISPTLDVGGSEIAGFAPTN